MKPIDKIEETDYNMCEHCDIQGGGNYSCNMAEVASVTALDLSINEFCTKADWDRCPFNGT